MAGQRDPRQWSPRDDTPRRADWVFLRNLGDVSFLDYGGYFIYKHATGVYPEEAERLIPDSMDESGDGGDPYLSTYTIYRFPLDRLKLVDGYLVPLKYAPDWPHPVEKYDEWFHEELGQVAESVGSTKAQMETALTSADPLDRAIAYEAIGNHFGWDNFDSYPLKINRREAEERYRWEMRRRRR